MNVYVDILKCIHLSRIYKNWQFHFFDVIASMCIMHNASDFQVMHIFADI